MIRRRVLGLAGALALAGVMGVGAAGALSEKNKAVATCACCGGACACTGCTCDTTAGDRAAAKGCDCCGDAACCPATA